MSYHFGLTICPQMEEKISTMEKISIYLFVYFTYFPYFAGSGVAARTPRREQAEGETSLRQNLFLKTLFYSTCSIPSRLSNHLDKLSGSVK